LSLRKRSRRRCPFFLSFANSKTSFVSMMTSFLVAGSLTALAYPRLYSRAKRAVNMELARNLFVCRTHP
jgi:hypothetical protein